MIHASYMVHRILMVHNFCTSFFMVLALETPENTGFELTEGTKLLVPKIHRISPFQGRFTMVIMSSLQISRLNLPGY